VLSIEPRLFVISARSLSYTTCTNPAPMLALREPINVVLLKKYTCNSGLMRRPRISDA